MQPIIDVAIRRHNRVAIKIVSKENPKPITYSDYTKKIEQSFKSLESDLRFGIESCCMDFPEDRVILSVIEAGSTTEKLYHLFDSPNEPK